MAGLAAASVASPAALAQSSGRDRVVLRTESGSRVSLGCTIIDYTGRGITLRTTAGGEIRTYSADEVVDVRTPQTESHIEGLRSFHEGKYDEAQSALERALVLEGREWVRREILAMLVRCALKKGDYHAASSRFVLLARSDPHTPHFHLAPLVWGPREREAALTGAARAWLTSSEEAARLLGASILLDDPRYGPAARPALEKLTASTNRALGELAAKQLWRLRLREARVADFQLERWRKQIDEMPEKLRGGPYYLLGRALLARRSHEPAARALLWVPLVYDHDHHLAARACLDAADALHEAGRPAEALTLYQEVATRFDGTPFAQEARQILDELLDQSPPASRERKLPREAGRESAVRGQKSEVRSQKSEARDQ